MSIKQSIYSGKAVATAFLLFALLLTPLNVFAAGMSQNSTVSGAELSGTLSDSSVRHYLGLDPNERDAEITLTLTFGPQSNGEIANKVNFWVLSQPALETTLDGTVRYDEVDLASGSPISGRNDDYKVQATFKVTGRDRYTVIVFSRAAASVNYTLTATNGTLSDDSGQTHIMTESQMDGSQSSMTDSMTMTDMTETADMSGMTGSSEMSGTAMSTKSVSAAIDARSQLYYTLVPVDNDEEVTLTFDYNPKDNSQLEGRINFFVFDSDGLSGLQNGERPEFANLAAGNVVKSGDSKLSATFRAVGKQTYVVMVTNRSNIPATFTLDLSGGDFQ